MLVLTREVHYLGNLGLRYLVRIDSADADAAPVHM
jgi:hypothetical protein